MNRKCLFCGDNFTGRKNQDFCTIPHPAECQGCGNETLLSRASLKKNLSVCTSCQKDAASKAHSDVMKQKFIDGELTGFNDPKNRQKAQEAVKEKYGVNNVSSLSGVQQKRKNTMRKKYGVDYAGQSTELQEKARKTNQKKYGVDNPFQSDGVKDKIKETNIEKYGSFNPMNNAEICAKQTATMKDRYDIDRYLQNPDNLLLHQKILKDKYGVDNSSKIDSVREKSCNDKQYVNDDDFKNFIIEYNKQNKTKINIIVLTKEFNYATSSPVYKRIKKLNLEGCIDYKISQTNLLWHALILDELGVDLKFEGKIFPNPRQRCDLYYEPLKIAIDINPTISHSTQKVHPIFEPKAIKYHHNRALDAESNGWILYQIYDWSPKDKVLQQLRNLFQLNTKRTFARKCVVVRPTKQQVMDFLDIHHVQGNAAVGSIFYGLEDNDEIVQVMTFSKERFKGAYKNGFELMRLASDGNVIGGASRLFKHFVRDCSPGYVKTFASLDRGHGLVYEKMGFSFAGYAGLNGLYSKPGTSMSYKTTTCSGKFGKEYKELGLTQQKYMNSFGFYRINDAGNKIFVWKSGVNNV